MTKKQLNKAIKDAEQELIKTTTFLKRYEQYDIDFLKEISEMFKQHYPGLLSSAEEMMYGKRNLNKIKKTKLGKLVGLKNENE